MSRPMVRQTTADDFNLVASRTEELLAEFSIDDDHIVDIEVQQFGSKRWLILVTYWGIYVYRAYIGFGKSAARVIGASRGLDAAGGLTSAVTRVFGCLLGVSAPLGLTSGAIERVYGVERAFSAAVGLLSTEADTYSLKHKETLSGLAVSVATEVGYAREETPVVGLTSDESYTHYSP